MDVYRGHWGDLVLVVRGGWGPGQRVSWWMTVLCIMVVIMWLCLNWAGGGGVLDYSHYPVARVGRLLQCSQAGGELKRLTV